MAIDSKTKELLAEGKAKTQARADIVNKYLNKIKHKASADLVVAGRAKKRAREEIVQKYLAMQP